MRKIRGALLYIPRLARLQVESLPRKLEFDGTTPSEPQLVYQISYTDTMGEWQHRRSVSYLWPHRVVLRGLPGPDGIASWWRGLAIVSAHTSHFRALRKQQQQTCAYALNPDPFLHFPYAPCSLSTIAWLSGFSLSPYTGLHLIPN